MTNPTISDLIYYPVKSCAGIHTDSIHLDSRGIAHDREFMLVGENGVRVTQRKHPSLAVVQPGYYNRSLFLDAPGMSSLELKALTEGERLKVQLHDKNEFYNGVDQGSEAAEWFSEYLNKPVRVVRMADDFVRQASRKYAKRPEDQVGFQDSFPLLMISEASLADLNHRLEEPVPMSRFRPNIVISGCEPYFEDRLGTVQIGDITFGAVKLCDRCPVVSVDQIQGLSKGPEPLKTLASYRRGLGPKKNKVYFGQNLILHDFATIKTGDEIIYL